MPVGMSYRELKQLLRLEYLWHKNSLMDWASAANLYTSYPIIDRTNTLGPNPHLSTALGVPCLQVDGNVQFWTMPGVAALGDDHSFMLEWAGIPGQPLDALDAIVLPQCLISDAGEGTYIQLYNPGEIQINLGAAVTSVNPGTDYYWFINQPLHLVIIRYGEDSDTIRVYVNGNRVELTDDAAGAGDISGGMLFNYDPLNVQPDMRPFIGSNFLFRVYDDVPSQAPNFLDETALLLFTRVRDAFPTLRWPIPIRPAALG